MQLRDEAALTNGTAAWKSKMDLDARTTVNQQKNKKQELMMCWFPHGRLWAVYLVSVV